MTATPATLTLGDLLDALTTIGPDTEVRTNTGDLLAAPVLPIVPLPAPEGATCAELGIPTHPPLPGETQRIGHVLGLLADYTHLTGATDSTGKATGPDRGPRAGSLPVTADSPVILAPFAEGEPRRVTGLTHTATGVVLTSAPF